MNLGPTARQVLELAGIDPTLMGARREGGHDLPADQPWLLVTSPTGEDARAHGELGRPWPRRPARRTAPEGRCSARPRLQEGAVAGGALGVQAGKSATVPLAAGYDLHVGAPTSQMTSASGRSQGGGGVRHRLTTPMSAPTRLLRRSLPTRWGEAADILEAGSRTWRKRPGVLDGFPWRARSS